MSPRLAHAIRPVAFLVSLALALPSTAVAQSSALGQSIAAAIANDANLKRFYEQRAYEPLWMGGSPRERQRLRAFFDVLEDAGDHGLPVASYRADALETSSGSARTAADKGRVEAALSRALADYAIDVQAGVVPPSQVSGEIHRGRPLRGTAATLAAFAQSSPSGFLDALPPQTREYESLLVEKVRLERELGAGGWGEKVPGGTLQRGSSGRQIVILRNRLSAIGYGRLGGSASFDAGLQQAVAQFQRDHGLQPDGVVGGTTLREINKTPSDRLRLVLAAMERERWMNYPRGRRHVWVNIPDFSASIVDRGRTTFTTRAVVGENRSTHRTPEFSDVMEFMVINPTWNVPRSITTREYLPLLKQNPNAVSHLQLLDENGNRVSRGSVNFASYSASDFPYRLKEPPSQGNALGLVKFMFPNRHNIYLHDTPQKALFNRNPRAFSHGCIRLAEPFEFAYTLLEPQASDPQALFQSKLDTRRETTLPLDTPIRVHLVYRTAFEEGGRMQFRPDIYGRDGMVFQALSRAGVSLRSVGG